jgi:hypothetical protein
VATENAQAEEEVLAIMGHLVARALSTASAANDGHLLEKLRETLQTLRVNSLANVAPLQGQALPSMTNTEYTRFLHTILTRGALSATDLLNRAAGTLA